MKYRLLKTSTYTVQHNTEKRGHISLFRTRFELIISVFKLYKKTWLLQSRKSNSKNNIFDVELKLIIQNIFWILI
jgi:hypothetical protein